MTKNIKYLKYLAIIAFSIPQLGRGASGATMMIRISLPPDFVVKSAEQEFAKEKYQEKINQIGSISPEKFVRKFLKKATRSHKNHGLSGIPAVYRGYVSYSDTEGIITFPLKHDEPETYIAITPQLKLVPLYQQTMSRMSIAPEAETIPPGTPAAPTTSAHAIDFPAIFKSLPVQIYNFSLKTENPDKPNWIIKKTDVPQDGAISNLGIAIEANPNNFFVPTGTFSGIKSNHMILPTIYLLGRKYNDKVLLNTLKLSQYFEPVSFETPAPKAAAPAMTTTPAPASTPAAPSPADNVDSKIISSF